jgi:hypothetical protein
MRESHAVWTWIGGNRESWALVALYHFVYNDDNVIFGDINGLFVAKTFSSGSELPKDELGWK